MGGAINLENVKGDVEIVNDDKVIIDRLANKNKDKRKNLHDYVECIRKLEEGRKVNFTHCSREENPAGLKQDGYSLPEITEILSDPKKKEEIRNLKEKLKKISKRETRKSRKKA